MKSILSYVLTRTEKIALLVIALLALLAGWYVGIYTPIQKRIAAADTTELEAEMQLEQMKAGRIKAMTQIRPLEHQSFLLIIISNRNSMN